MSQKNIEKMIPIAVNIAQSELVKDGGIESKYMAHIAAMGVSVLQSGIKPTYYFYESKKVKEMSLPQIVVQIINKTYHINKSFENYDNKQDILDAITALKLVARSFEKLDNREEDDE